MKYKNAYEIVSNKNRTHEERVKELTIHLRNKGYGDREQELQFISDFFKQVFKSHYQLYSFKWSQYQDYNDNYLYFDLQNFTINEFLFISIYGFDWFDEDEWKYAIKVDDASADGDWDKWYKELEDKYGHLRALIDFILIF